MDTEKIINSAIRDQLAKSILEGIGEEARNAIIAKSITDAMKDYTFKCVLEKQVTEFAQAKLAEMLAMEEWVETIEQAIQDSFDEFMLDIRQAIPLALAETFSGRDDNSSYNRSPGSLLKHIVAERHARAKSGAK